MNSQVIEGNREIAEFMRNHAINSPHLKKDNELDYHQSWSGLMSVVEKIWKMGKMISLNLYTEGGGTVNCKIYNWGLGEPYQDCESKSPIEAVWLSVIDFIQYNKQKEL